MYTIIARNKISAEHSQQKRCVYQVCGVSGRRLLHMFPQYCKAAIYNHFDFDKRELNK